jgi:hypothetical protein
MDATINPMYRRRHPRNKRGDTILLGEILLFAGVVTLGVALWALSLGYVSSQGTQISREYDRMISQHRILLVVEAASLQTNAVWVSNPGMNDVIVISCTIYPKSRPSPGIRYNIQPTIVAASPDRFETIQGCERYPGEPPYIVELWYMPAHLYSSADPARNVMSAQVARYEAR